MKYEKLSNALDKTDEKFIAETAEFLNSADLRKPRKKIPFALKFTSIAACACVAVGLSVLAYQQLAPGVGVTYQGTQGPDSQNSSQPTTPDPDVNVTDFNGFTGNRFGMRISNGSFYEYGFINNTPYIAEYDPENKTKSGIVNLLSLKNDGVDTTCFAVTPSGFIFMGEEPKPNEEPTDTDRVYDVYTNFYFLSFDGQALDMKQVKTGTVSFDGDEWKTETDKFDGTNDVLLADDGYIYGTGCGDSSIIRINPLTGERQEIAKRFTEKTDRGYSTISDILLGLYDNYIYSYYISTNSEIVITRYDINDPTQKERITIPKRYVSSVYTTELELHSDGTITFYAKDENEAVSAIYYTNFDENLTVTPLPFSISENTNDIITELTLIGDYWYFVKNGSLCRALRNGTEVTEIAAEGQLYDKYFNNGYYYTIDAYTDEYIILNGYSDIYIISTGDAVPFTER
ncbi:MAG: hypothetical protein J1E39_08505 [Eubacterium sp.]|nr:hypothetical protein [Eubacterium sp.]